MSVVGAPINRTDGWAKVSGAARYSAEHFPPQMAHAVMVTSTVPAGRVKRIEADSNCPGVLLVFDCSTFTAEADGTSPGTGGRSSHARTKMMIPWPIANQKNVAA